MCVMSMPYSDMRKHTAPRFLRHPGNAVLEAAGARHGPLSQACAVAAKQLVDAPSNDFDSELRGGRDQNLPVVDILSAAVTMRATAMRVRRLSLQEVQ